MLPAGKEGFLTVSPEIGLAATRLALFVIILCGLLFFWVPRDSAEFVVLVITLLTALLLLGIVALLARAGTARWGNPPPKEPPDDGDSKNIEGR
jgi:hypothetical protein